MQPIPYPISGEATPQTQDRKTQDPRLETAALQQQIRCFKVTGLATLIISLGLCCAGALAKPNASSPVDPRKFEEYQSKAETGDADAQFALGDIDATIPHHIDP